MGERVVNKKAVMGRVDRDRRDFVKKALVGSAFSAPLMASFRMDSLSVGSARAATFSNNSDGGFFGLFRWLFYLIRQIFGGH